MTLLVHKTTLLSTTSLVDVDDVNGILFTLSDESEDAAGDIIRVNGWRFDHFNGVALFGHMKDFIIGRWKDWHVKGTKLMARLVLAPKGSSPRIDEIRALISCGALRAASVGFAPIKSRPRANGSTEYLEQSLLECSVVAVGCNPSALLEAKRLGVSNATITKIFRKQTRNATLSERIAASKAAVKRYDAAERSEILRRAKAKLAAMNSPSYRHAPPKLTAQQKRDAEAFAKKEQEEADRKAYCIAVHNKAKAKIAEWKREEDLQARARHLARQDPPPFKPEPQYVLWRGQRIKIRSYDDGW